MAICLHGEALRFTTFRFGRAQKSKLFLEEKVTYVLRFFEFLIFFFCPSFFSFSFLFAAVIGLLLGLLAVKQNVNETGNFYHGVIRCSGRKFCSEFFSQLFEHFCAYLKLYSTGYSELRIIGKIFSSSRSELSIDWNVKKWGGGGWCHSSTRLSAARWQDSMSLGQKSWNLFNYPHWFFVRFWTMWR